MERERETVDEKKEDQDETFVIQDTGSDDEESDESKGDGQDEESENFFISLGLDRLAELGKAAPFMNNHYS